MFFFFFFFFSNVTLSLYLPHMVSRREESARDQVEMFQSKIIRRMNPIEMNIQLTGVLQHSTLNDVGQFISLVSFNLSMKYVGMIIRISRKQMSIS